MSWDGYVEGVITAEKALNSPIMELAISGTAPGSVLWGSTPGLASIVDKEISQLNGNHSGMAACGPHIAGRKWFYVRNEGDSLILQRKGDDITTLVVTRTQQAIIIAAGKAGRSAGEVLARMHHIAQELSKRGY